MSVYAKDIFEYDENALESERTDEFAQDFTYDLNPTAESLNQPFSPGEMNILD